MNRAQLKGISLPGTLEWIRDKSYSPKLTRCLPFSSGTSTLVQLLRAHSIRTVYLLMRYDLGFRLSLTLIADSEEDFADSFGLDAV